MAPPLSFAKYRCSAAVRGAKKPEEMLFLRQNLRVSGERCAGAPLKLPPPPGSRGEAEGKAGTSPRSSLKLLRTATATFL